MIAVIIISIILLTILVFIITLLQDDIALMRAELRGKDKTIDSTIELLLEKDIKIDELVYFLHIDKTQDNSDLLMEMETMLTDLRKELKETKNKISKLSWSLHIHKTHDNSDLFIYLKNAKCFLLATVELLKDHPMHEEFIEALSQIELIDYLLINFLHTETK